MTTAKSDLVKVMKMFLNGTLVIVHTPANTLITN